MPPGDYKVTIVLHQVALVGDEYKTGPNLVALEYGAPQTTPLQVKVTEGDNQFANWEVAPARR
ncbi:MAG: hypothetical protein AB7O62_06920 [Pirellulales bacterium]